jgi:hypothetical protein
MSFYIISLLIVGSGYVLAAPTDPIPAPVTNSVVIVPTEPLAGPTTSAQAKSTIVVTASTGMYTTTEWPPSITTDDKIRNTSARGDFQCCSRPGLDRSGHQDGLGRYDNIPIRLVLGSNRGSLTLRSSFTSARSNTLGGGSNPSQSHFRWIVHNI